MRVTNYEIYTADVGYRRSKYLRILTDSGIDGWSEYYDQFNGAPLEPSIDALVTALKTHQLTPTDSASLSDTLHILTKVASGGTNHQAIAAIENACIDIQAKHLGIPASLVIGGRFRDEVNVYWTHYGSFRAAFPDFFESHHGFEPLRSFADLARIAPEVQRLGVTAVKTNPIRFVDGRSRMYGTGTRYTEDLYHPSLTRNYVRDIRSGLEVIRESLGSEIDLMLDINFVLPGDSILRLVDELEEYKLCWLEFDGVDPQITRQIRNISRTPVASLESLYGFSALLPYFREGSVDIPIVDVIWNGARQAGKIATLAEAFGLDVAIHNPVGDLGTLISAHYAAAFKNIRVLEMRLDESPTLASHMKNPPQLKNGRLQIPNTPGWGAEMNLNHLTLTESGSK